jgi:periplasmic protein TonB
MTIVSRKKEGLVRTILSVVVAALALVASSAAQEQQVYKPGKDGVKAPVLIKEVKPRYTDAAKARGVQGSVEMVVIVQTDGTVGDEVRVTKSLDPDLDQEAIVAMRQWRFKPGTKDDKPVDVEVNVEMTFTLK